MSLQPHDYIHTEGDGLLGTTTPADVAALVSSLRSDAVNVLHVHGGLVSRAEGLVTALRIRDFHAERNIRAVFPIWESGLVEVVRNNLREIAKEEIFGVLLRRLLKWAVGKISSAPGTRGRGAREPDDIVVLSELQRRRVHEEPFAEVAIPPDVQELDDAERPGLERELLGDGEFKQEVRAIAPPSNARRSAAVPPKPTLMSPEVLEELQDDRGTRAAGLGFGIARRAGYWEVPVVYPRSLLYLVSGILEREGDGEGAYDRPLVGMERYHVDAATYDDPSVQAVRAFVATAGRAVWAEWDGGPALRSNANRHAGFDDTVDRRTTMESVAEYVAQ